MSGRALWFLGPRAVELRRQHPVPLPSDGLRVRTEVSAISAGTELLFYRGELEQGIEASPTLSPGEGYPLPSGYASVGEVIEAGPAAPDGLLGKRVFSFHPHQEEISDRAAAFQLLPAGVSAEAGSFLANLETAVSLVMDGAPLIGERVAVVGQGVVGQLTAALLVQTGVEEVHLVDPRVERLAPRLFSPSARVTSAADVGAETRGGFDLVFELSGRPEALDGALQLARYGGRVVVGSWYGNRRAPVELGTRVHRSHLTLFFSQVSQIDARHAARFDKARRLQVAAQWLTRLPLESLVTHRVPFAEAARAYQLLDSGPADVLQVLLTHR